MGERPAVLTHPARRSLLEVRKAMSLLPTAHAGQSFGARRIDFYTVSGEVSASDDGMGRVTDTDGMAHDVRLLERSNALAPGDTASVLRVQAGPNRRSRPAAIVNHTRGTWMRAAPEATGLLARSGVTRGFNWWLSVLALALVAIAAVWPAIHGFLAEVNANLIASVPAFDVYAEIAAFLPGLPGWRLEAALPSGILDALASLGFIPMAQLTEWGLGVGAGLLALLSFLGRSWRLVYIPALGALALAAGSILGAALPTLAIIGGSLLLFMLGGLINRVRDGGRFNARVARLAEHALRNPPEEGVRASDKSGAAKAGVVASAAIAAATATAEGNDGADVAETAATEADTASGPESGASAEAEDSPEAIDESEESQAAIEDGASEAVATDEIPQDDNGSGEVEAPAQDDLLPAAPTDDTETEIAADAAIPDAAGDAEAPADAVQDTETAQDIEAPGAESDASDEVEPIAESVASEDAEAELAPAAVEESVEAHETTTSEAVDASTNSESVSETDEDLPDQAETGTEAEETEIAVAESEIASAEAEITDAEAVVADTEAEAADPTVDEDLPSLDDVAAAAALTAVETADPQGDDAAISAASPASVDLDDERTMPVAPPPPMPGNDTLEAEAGVESEATPETVIEAEPAASADDQPESEPVATAATEASDTPAAPIVDDPLMDGDLDPMMGSDGKADYAPGAPDVDLDRTPIGQN